MLKKIVIDSFVIFENQSLEFEAGMTVITGITGSGKSVLFDAIEFAFGNKLARKVTAKTKPLNVELTFVQGSEQITIQHIKANTSKFYLNGKEVCKSKIKALESKLLGYQRQNQHLQSLDNKYQRSTLDAFAKHTEIILELDQMYYAWQEQSIELKQLETKLAAIDLELNAHFLEELQSLRPDADDWIEINEQLRLAKSNEKVNISAEKSQVLIQKVIEQLEQLLVLNDASNNLHSCLKQALVAANEAACELQESLTKPCLSEYELEQIETRVQEYFRLARKHKVRPEQLEEVFERYQSECELAQVITDKIQQLEQVLAKLASEWQAKAVVLAKSRQAAAIVLGNTMQEKLAKLNMQVELLLEFELKATATPSLNGGGTLTVLIATKPGQVLKPIAKVVSGGEAARISLVMQELLIEDAKTYLMDEVDVGVSGAVASAIGKLLARIATNNQVICITHTPQVAAIATHHISMSNGAKVLGTTQRIEEIAAMLCHEGITDSAIEQAKELIG